MARRDGGTGFDAAGRNPKSALRRAHGARPAGRAGAARPPYRMGARRRWRTGAYQRSARQRLRSFRQGSALAIALTALVLLLWGGSDSAPGQEPSPPESPLVPQDTALLGTPADTAATPREAVEEATGTVRDLVVGFYGLLPKIGIAIALLLLAALLVRLARSLLRRLLGEWEKAEATTALAGILIWLVALGAALSVIAGDARALVGSVGLFGLALSWALQAPIESFTGWLMNSFKSYYRIGDRIAVGDVFGDVYKIDFLTTTVWETGGLEKAVVGEQATGVLITFPNSEVLRANIVNLTREFPFVWDEVSINMADECDLPYTSRVFQQVARRVIGPAMSSAVEEYRTLLRQAGLAYEVAPEPQVFFSPADAWTNVTVRYLIPARERRRWSSDLVVALSAEIANPEHRGRIFAGYPRTQVEMITGPDGQGPERHDR